MVSLGNDTVMRILILFFLVLAPLVDAVAATRVDSLYRCLDAAIADSSAFIAKREDAIRRIRDKYVHTGEASTRYVVALELYEEYKPFMNDSALAWLGRARDEARRCGDRAGENRCLALTAYQCSNTGMYTEAVDILSSIDKSVLGRDGLVDYYMAYNHLYGELGYYCKVRYLKDKYFALAHVYADSLLAVAAPDSDIRLQLLETTAYNEGDYAKALRYNDMRLKLAMKESHRMAIVAFYRYLDYKMLGDTDEWTYWLAMSALLDVRNAVMDQAALWELANSMYSRGEIERSYRYINFASACASKFSTRLRNQQITPVMQVIDNMYQMQNRRENTYLKAAIVLTGVFMLIVLAFLVYLTRQRRRLTATGNHLNDAVANLDESNRVKEKYIGLFLRQCSSYIDRMDAMRRDVFTMLKAKRYAELYDMVKTHDFRDKEQEELFEIFDSTFIRLFPTFVDEFNQLLKPDSRISLPDQAKLTTGIRIFALIRLGIDDSSKIAEFLHYSVNTIYNYRAKIKNGAVVNREEFEDLVKAIGLPKGVVE